MKHLSKSARTALSSLLAVIMLLSVFSVGMPAATAADTKAAATAATPDELDPSDVKSVEIEDVTLYKGEDCEEIDEYDEEDEDYHYYNYYFYSSYIKGKLILNDDTELDIINGRIECNKEDYNVNIIDDQSWKNPWEVGSHEVKIDVLGTLTVINVELTEFTYKSFEIKDVEITEGLDSYETETEDSETGKKVTWNRYYYNLDYTITLDDGTVLTSGEENEVRILDKYVSPELEDGQSAETPWGVGSHKVKATLMGKTEEFTVTVKENPFEKVTCEDVEVMENLDLITVYENTGDEEEPIKWMKYYYSPKFTAVLKDGTVIESDEYGTCLTYDGREYYPGYVDDQTAENHWENGDHKVTMKLCGLETEFTVTLKESPVKDLSIEDVDVFKDVDEDEDFDFETGEIYKKYYYTPQFTVTLADGSELKGKNGNVTIDGKKYTLEITDGQSSDSLWKVGSYTVIGSLAGVDAKFKVNVGDNPIIKIEPEDVEKVYGVDETYRYDDDDESYPIINTATKCRLTMYDGSVIDTDDDGLFFFHDTELCVSFTDDQTADNKWSEGEHTSTAFYGDVKADFKVKVLPSPIEKVEIDDVEIYENIDAFDPYEDDEDVSGKKFYNYRPRFKVYDKNGKVYDSADSKIAGTPSSVIKYNDRFYALECEDDQDKNEWKPGDHKVKGRILGVEAEFTVTLKDDPVASIVCEDIELIENEDGYYEVDDDETDTPSRYFFYEVDRSKLKVTVTLKDGTVLKSDKGVIKALGNIYGAYAWIKGQTFAKRLKLADTVTAEGEVMNKPFTFNAKIVKSPVKSVKIEPIYPVNGADTYDTDGYDYYSYSSFTFDFTVTLENGETLKSKDGSVTYGGVTYVPHEFVDDQSLETPWEAGKTYTAKCMVMGKETEVQVNPIESPVEKAEFADITVDAENIDTVYDEEENETYPVYYFGAYDYTVTLKDGTVLKSSDEGEIEYRGQIYSFGRIKTDQSFDNRWEVGNTYEATVSILGYDATVKVKVVDTQPDVKPTQPTDAVQPTETTAPTETSELPTVPPTDPTSATEPTDVTKATDPQDVNGPAESTPAATEPTQPTEVTQPTQATDATIATQPATKDNRIIENSTPKTTKKTKKANPLKVKKLKVKAVKAKNLKSKKITVKVIKVSKAKGRVSYKKLSGSTNLKLTKKGKIVIKKGTKKGTYKIKIRVTAKGNSSFKKKTKTIKITIKVK